MVIALTLACPATPAVAQVSEGGFPPSFRYQIATRSGETVENIPVTFHVDDLKRVDEWQSSEGAPAAVATLIDVSLTPRNAGRWVTLPDGERVWQLTLRAEGAIALMLYYSDFYIPTGGKLFLYNADKSHLLGAYTHRTHPDGGRFATEFVAGDEVTFEYAASPDDSRLRIEIEAVGYGYNHLSVPDKGAVTLRAAASCEVNINCSEGDTWQNQKKGVCRMMQRINSKSYVCSGTLLNNTAQDLKPYILSAHHCSVDGNKVEATDGEMEQWVFYFHSERSGCSDQSAPTSPRTMTGCRRVAMSEINGGADGLLLLLNTSIPEDYNVYYNGWDKQEIPAQTGVGIHHPAGDNYKKISTFKSPALSHTFITDNSNKGDTNAYWNVIFDETQHGHGVTEKGSSGSPLFNENRLVVGSLTGGSSSCLDPEGLNLYGKLSCHWSKYKYPMNKYLDPKGSGVETLSGRYHSGRMPQPVNLKASFRNKSLQLTWEKPTQDVPLTYYVYDNDTRIAETTQSLFTQEAPEAGMHNYSVSALYANDRESDLSTTALRIPEYKAPENVSAILTASDNIAVRWEPPFYEQTVYWGNVYAATQLTLDDYRRFYFGQLWEKEELTPFHRKTLTAVRFVPVRNNTYEIYIVQGDRTYRQEVVNSPVGTVHTVELTTPFVVDARQRLIVSAHVLKSSTRPVDYPAVCDAGPAIVGKGNVFSYDGKRWELLYDENVPEENYNVNFFLAAVVSSGEGELPEPFVDGEPEQLFANSASFTYRRRISTSLSPGKITPYSLQPDDFPEVTGYNIYRNGSLKGTASASVRRYVDTSPALSAQYQVSALFGDDEGLLSPQVTLSAQAQVEVDATAVYPTVFDGWIEIRGVERVSRMEVYAADGKCRLRIEHPEQRIETHSLPAGVYFFRLSLKNGRTEVFRGIKTGRPTQEQL